MTSTTTKSDSSQPTADMAGDLFDNWFDPLEAEMRPQAGEFIEELLRGELETGFQGFTSAAGCPAVKEERALRATTTVAGRDR